MPQWSGLTYRLGRGAVTLGPDGSIVSVLPRSGLESYLTGGGRVRAWVGEDEVCWTEPTVTADVDEAQFDVQSAGGLGLVVRHSFAGGWCIRVALVNHTPKPMDVRAELGWVPAPDCPAWALGAEATGAYAIPRPTGRAPLLGGELVLGTCPAVSARAIDLGRTELGPLGRTVVQWRWEWYADPRSFNRRRFAAVPAELVLPEGETAWIAADDDQAVVAPGVDLERRGGQLELSPRGAHATTVQVSSRRGVTRYPLEWAEPLDEVLDTISAAVLDGPLTPAGVLRLADLDTALVVQHLLARGQVADPEAAEDALDLFVSRLADGDVVDGRGLSLLVGESTRTGDEEALDRAAAALLRQGYPVPGLGIAAAEIGLARLALGRPFQEVLDHVAELVSVADAGTDLGTAVRLELRLTTTRRVPGDDRDSDRRAVDPAVRRLGTALGAGLRGRPVRPRPLDEQAYLAVVLGLLPEGLGARLRSDWGARPHDVARTAQSEVLTRLGRRRPRAAHSWLILATRLA